MCFNNMLANTCILFMLSVLCVSIVLSGLNCYLICTLSTNYEGIGDKRTKITDILIMFLKLCSQIRKCGVIECDKMILTGLERTVSCPFSLYVSFISHKWCICFPLEFDLFTLTWVGLGYTFFTNWSN